MIPPCVAVPVFAAWKSINNWSDFPPNLQDDLRHAGIEPWAWVINNSIAATHTNSPLLRRCADNELREINAVAHQYAHRYAVAPLLLVEPVGVARLLELAG